MGASGARGLRELEIALVEDKRDRGSYDVRLYFCEPETAPAEARVFDVLVQGKLVAEGLDVAAAAGGSRRMHVLETPGVRVADTLRIVLRPHNETGAPPILSGVEAVRCGLKPSDDERGAKRSARRGR